MHVCTLTDNNLHMNKRTVGLQYEYVHVHTKQNNKRAIIEARNVVYFKNNNIIRQEYWNILFAITVEGGPRK